MFMLSTMSIPSMLYYLAIFILSKLSIKTHDSESRGQEEAGRTRDEQVSYLHVAPL